MKSRLLIASGVFLAALAGASMPAQAKTMKECAAEWDAMKAAKQTNGMKYRDFSKQCMSGEPAPAAETKAPPPPPPPPKTMTTTTTPPPAKPMSPGRAAMIARERACGAEWKADKAAGKITVGMKWPQYWSACDKRKKAEGM
jgi:hypothetical protein